MTSDGFWAFIGWTVLVATVAFFVGGNEFTSEIADKCVKGDEITIEATIFTCKPVALVSKGIRAEIK